MDLQGQGLTRKEALTRLRTEKEAAMEAIAGDLDGLTREATLGQLKLDRMGASFFEMPLIEQVRLWNATRDMHWFRVGGVWRDAETSKQDEVLAQEDEAAGDLVAEIATPAWTYLASEIQHILSALNEDVRYERACVKSAWSAAQAMAFEKLVRRSIRDSLLSMIPQLPEPSDSAEAPRQS